MYKPADSFLMSWCNDRPSGYHVARARTFSPSRLPRWKAMVPLEGEPGEPAGACSAEEHRMLIAFWTGQSRPGLTGLVWAPSAFTSLADLSLFESCALGVHMFAPSVWPCWALPLRTSPSPSVLGCASELRVLRPLPTVASWYCL